MRMCKPVVSGCWSRQRELSAKRRLHHKQSAADDRHGGHHRCVPGAKV